MVAKMAANMAAKLALNGYNLFISLSQSCNFGV